MRLVSFLKRRHGGANTVLKFYLVLILKIVAYSYSILDAAD